ncbi:MAG: hypothetical protein Q4D85_13575 [Corynebacterium sp.]|uniref:hypothetical protein n=1 Tax=Corynebacterium sp. TaxID=1720 RepID=UPI0026DB27F1|nr:hypothetical protein [Corynebacterium sp.]MDO5099765.1 hypothetical protein [Corynebacterium sp.]
MLVDAASVACGLGLLCRFSGSRGLWAVARYFPGVLVPGGWILRLDGVAGVYPFGGGGIFYGTGWGRE